MAPVNLRAIRMISDYVKRIKWRIGRRLYSEARGEQRSGDIRENGEHFLQILAMRNARDSECFHAIDIGSNKGEWTEALLSCTPPDRKCSAGIQIDAFEPVPGTAEIYRKNVLSSPSNKFTTLHEVAISSNIGEATIAVYGDGAGTNSMHFDRDEIDGVLLIKVRALTLDHFCELKNLKHINLVKSDTEGNDLEVLLGARELLRTGKIDVFQFEYNHRWVKARAYLKDVFDLVEDLEYVVARVDPAQLCIFQQWHPELERYFQSNYALIHNSVVSWFPCEVVRIDEWNTFSPINRRDMV